MQVLILLMTLVSWAGAPGVMPGTGGAGAAAHEPARQSFHLVYEAVMPEVPSSAQQAFLWLPYPPDTPQQTVTGMTIKASVPYDLVTEPRYGNVAVRFTLPAGAREQTVVMEFDVLREEHVNRPYPRAGAVIPASLAGTQRDGAAAGEIALWLQPDRRVPVDGLIREWATETVAGYTSDLGRARAIYDYVVDNLTYDKSGEGWGRGDIFWACDTLRGNCTDFHAVFIGYARAVGIPTRFEIGFPIPAERRAGEVAGYHCWAEFYLEGSGWVPVDASEAFKHPEKREYYFGAHDANRVLFSVGRDLVLPGMAGDPLNFFIDPYAEVNGSPISTVQRRLFYTRK